MYTKLSAASREIFHATKNVKQRYSTRVLVCVCSKPKYKALAKVFADLAALISLSQPPKLATSLWWADK